MYSLFARKPIRIWLLWLVSFYLTWVWLVFGLGQWGEVLAHWPIALSMALGSYVAGSTPMGGGTVGFPVLVLFFDLPASLGRDFSFAIQSIGMVSASIFILVRRQPLARAMLRGAMLGALVGTPVGLAFIAPLVPDIWVKVVFAVIWASFGILHLYRINEIAAHEGMTEFDEHWDFRVGLTLGALSSVLIVSVTGVGIDMVLYAALVLLARADLRIAIPTSVIIMGFNSLVGLVVKLATSGLQPGVYENWLAAAPVVILGAPLGVFIVHKIGRKPTLLVVAVLCVLQYLWTMHVVFDQLGMGGVTLSLLSIGAWLLIFEKLRSWGAKLAGGH